MNRVVWSVSSQQDLRSVRDYIALDSGVNARRFIARIKQSVMALKRLPESGSLLPEEGFPSLREIFVGNYRVIYDYDGHETVHIVRIVHGARLAGLLS